MLKAVASITLRDSTDMHVGPEAPASPADNQLWLNTSSDPAVLVRWDNSEGTWKQAGADPETVAVLLQQVADQAALLQGKADKSDLDGLADKIWVSDRLQSEIDQQADSITQRIVTERVYAESVDDRLEIFKTLVEAYMSFTTAGLAIGGSDSDFSVLISKTRISFMQNGAELAYYANNRLYVTQAEFSSGITVGNTANGFYDLTSGQGRLTCKYRW